MWEWGYAVLWGTYLQKAFKFAFGASSQIKDKATRRRAQFMSMLCVVYEILYVLVCIWEPSLVTRVIPGVILMVVCYAMSRTKYTLFTNILFVYGTTAWNLYLVVYSSRISHVSTALRLVGLPLSTLLIFVVAVVFKNIYHCVLNVIILEVVYISISSWASSTSSVNLVNVLRNLVLMGVMVLGYSVIAAMDMAESNKHKQRFKTLFNLTGEAVLVCRDENIVDVNVSFESLFRCKRDDVVEKLTLRQILPAIDDIVASSSSSPSILRAPTEVIIETFDKVKLWAEVRIHTGVLEGNAVSVFTLTDITTRKQVQEAENRALRAAVANEAKNQFLATMSHEMRTPIAGVISSVDLLDGTSLSKEQRNLVDLTRVCARSLLDTINDILDFTKIETGKLELENTEINLIKLVEECVMVVFGNAHKKALEIVTTVSGDVPMHVMGDATRIKQVLLNFLSNAVKFTSHGQILVHLTVVPLPASSAPRALEDKVSLKFTISDSGIGINPKYFAKLFEPFGQLDTGNTRKYGGTGLGLSLSRRFCEKMGGTVALVHSEEGKGSTFEFNIVLDKLRDDNLQQLGAEIGHVIHETASDSPEFTPLLSTPSSTLSTPSSTSSTSTQPTPSSGASQVISPSSSHHAHSYSYPPPLSLSQSQVLPTSPSNTNNSSFLSPTSFVNLFSSTSSAQSPLASPVSYVRDVWVALVLEQNKFTAQSILHYLKLLSFHPDLSFAFDTPTDLLKYLAGASTRASRRRTVSYRPGANNGARRRVCIFAHTHTPHREALEKALNDPAISDKVYAWVWITPPHGNVGDKGDKAEKELVRLATVTKPIFFSDLARCLIRTFNLPYGYLGLWSTYFPDNLHASMSRAGSSAELRFNRDSMTMSFGASLLPSANSTPYISSSSYVPNDQGYPILNSVSITSTTSTTSTNSENVSHSAPLLPRSTSSPDPRPLSTSPVSPVLVSALSSETSPSSQRRISTPTPVPTPEVIKVLRKSLQMRTSADYSRFSENPGAIVTTSTSSTPRNLETQDSASSDDFYYNNYHCQLSSPTSSVSSPSTSPPTTTTTTTTTARTPSSPMNSPPFFTSPQLSIELSSPIVPTGKSNNNRSSQPKQKRILVVDDNVLIRKLLSKMLVSCGYSVVTASGGQQALDIIRTDRGIDLVLLDIQMPEMDGYEVTRQVRLSEEGTGVRLPIIAVTANAVSTEKSECVQRGMDDCLIKPVQKEYLLTVLSHYLST